MIAIVVPVAPVKNSDVDVRAVDDEYGKIEAPRVDVAKKRAAVGVLVARTVPLPFVARMPFRIEGKVMVPERRISPLNVFESERSVVEAAPILAPMHEPLIAKHPPVRLIPREPVDVAVKLIALKLTLPRVEVPEPVRLMRPVTPRYDVVALPSDVSPRSNSAKVVVERRELNEVQSAL